MIPEHARNTYRSVEAMAEPPRPAKLVHMLFERCLVHLKMAGEGVLENDARKRGESLGKVVDIIAGLNGSLNMEQGKDAAVFLRGLYESILLELPKVAITNDIEILKRAYRYVKKLKEVWEQTALKESGQEDVAGHDAKTMGSQGTEELKTVQPVVAAKKPSLERPRVSLSA